MSPFDFYMIGFLLTLWFKVAAMSSVAHGKCRVPQSYKDLRANFQPAAIIVMVVTLSALWPFFWPAFTVVYLKRSRG